MVRWRSAAADRPRVRWSWPPTRRAFSRPARWRRRSAGPAPTTPPAATASPEACTLLGLDGRDIVVNVRGDEPLIDPALVAACAERLQAHPECDEPPRTIDSVEEYLNLDVVKVVTDAPGGRCTSRAPMPWWRDGHAQGVTARSIRRRCPSASTLTPPALRHFPALPSGAARADRVARAVEVLWHGNASSCTSVRSAPAPASTHARRPGAGASHLRTALVRGHLPDHSAPDANPGQS